MSSPAHVNSSDAIRMVSRASGASGGVFCASAAFASLTHSCDFRDRAFALVADLASKLAPFCFLPPH